MTYQEQWERKLEGVIECFLDDNWPEDWVDTDAQLQEWDEANAELMKRMIGHMCNEWLAMRGERVQAQAEAFVEAHIDSQADVRR